MYLHHDIDKTKNKTEDNWHIFQVQGSMARECPYKCAPHVCVCVGCSNSECVCPYMFKVSSQHTNTFRKKGHIYYREEMHSSSLMGTSPILPKPTNTCSQLCSMQY